MLLTSSLVSRKQFVQALTWFEDGFWQLDDHAKFASYWIAIEQLVTAYTGGKKGEALAEYIPKLIVTWRNVRHAAFVIGQYLREIYSHINNSEDLKMQLSMDNKLKDWNEYDYIVLENLQRLKELSAGTVLERSIVDLTTWLTVQKKQDIINDIKALQMEKKFEIALFYSKRHSIMHEGTTYSADLEYLVKPLEETLVNTILVLLTYSSMNILSDVINTNSRPFLVNP
jgi:hypothetical protein